ncbi:MAG: metal-sulfur cluster assembly factor [Methanocellales archaeon]|nr:metal-sulfur cluster assembly factor [Methanocellales archaeon]
MKMVSKDEVEEALKEVMDPELGVSLVDLNLIKDITIEGDVVRIKMTLTSPFCPLSGYIVNQVKEKVESLGVKAEVDLIF